jgi:arsenate reductase
MIKVLFLCVHNSGRSQMAEAFLNHLGRDFFISESAGVEPSPLNPLVIKAMNDIGYDISRNSVDSVFNFFKEGRHYSMVIKVCDMKNGQKCPIFPMTKEYLDWSLPDPESFIGSEEEKLVQITALRDTIKELVIDLIKVYKDAEIN